MGEMKASEHLGDFLAFLRLELQLSPRTVDAYRRDLQRLLAEGDDALPDRARVLEHLASLRARLAPASAARALAAIRAFGRFLHAEGRVERDPAEGLLGPRLEARLPKVLGRRSVEALLAIHPRGTPLERRNRAILHTLYATGCRVSELVGLRTHGLLAEQDFLIVRGKGDRERMVPLTPLARDELEHYLHHVRPGLAARARGAVGDALFLSRTGRPLDRQRIFQVLRAACDRAGITVACSPHAMRHSFATHLVGGGADLRVVQELLGHASLATTQIYTHVDAGRLQAVHRACHPRGGSPVRGSSGSGSPPPRRPR